MLGFFNGFIFWINCFPSILYSDLLQGFCGELLHMKPICDNRSWWKTFLSDQVHICRHIKSNFSYLITFSDGDFLDDCYDVVCFDSSYNCYNWSLFSFCCFIGGNRVQLTSWKRCFVNWKMFTDIFFGNQPVLWRLQIKYNWCDFVFDTNPNVFKSANGLLNLLGLLEFLTFVVWYLSMVMECEKKGSIVLLRMETAF